MNIKKTTLTAALLSCVFLAGCGAGSKNAVPNESGTYSYNMNIIEEDNETISGYKKRYGEALEKIAGYDYDAAEKQFKELYEDLSSDTENAVTFLKAETDYALGRVYDLKGQNGESYDHYNSACVFYRDIFGSDAPRTMDAMLQTTLSGRDADVLRVMEDITESDCDRVYKDIALCIEGYEYVGHDNKKEVQSRFDRISELSENAAFTKDDPEETERLYSEAPETTSVLGRFTQRDIYRRANDFLCAYYEATDDPDGKIRICEKELGTITGEDLKSQERKALLLSVLGANILHYKGEAEGNEYIDEALQLYEKLYPTGSRLAGVNVTIGEKHAALGDYDRFYEYLRKAEGLIRKDSGENSHMLALVYLRMAFYYDLKSDYNTAAEYSQKAIDIYEVRVEDETSAIAAGYNLLANAYAATGDYSKVKDYYEKSAEIYRDRGDALEYATTQRNRALITNNSFGDHEEALKYARKALAVAESLGHANDGKNIAAIYMLMPDILKPGDPDYPKIEEYCKKAYECLQNAVGNTDQYVAYYHYNLGYYLKDNSRYEEALEHLEEAEVFFQKIYDEEWLYPVDVLYDMGYCLYMEQDYEKAREMLIRAEQFESERIQKLAENGGKAEWCRYLGNNRKSARGMLASIERNMAE